MTNDPPPFRLIPLPGHGPEDVVADRDGRLLTGLDDGRILRVDPTTGATEVIASTGGRPLGLEPLPDGRILVCDSPKGLLILDPATGDLRTLVDRADGEALPFCSNVVAQANGTIFFSVSSMRYTVANWRADLAENIPTGRLYRLRPGGEPERLLDGLLFANGVALAPDLSYVLVAESGRYRIHRYWLTGARANTTEIFCDLPGFPDNMGGDPDGLVWIALASPRNALLKAIHSLPLPLRRLVARLPPALQPKPAKLAWVVAIDAAGVIVRDFRWDDAGYSMVTGICRHGNSIYCSSLHEEAILSFEI